MRHYYAIANMIKKSKNKINIKINGHEFNIDSEIYNTLIANPTLLMDNEFTTSNNVDITEQLFDMFYLNKSIYGTSAQIFMTYEFIDKYFIVESDDKDTDNIIQEIRRFTAEAAITMMSGKLKEVIYLYFSIYIADNKTSGFVTIDIGSYSYEITMNIHRDSIVYIVNSHRTNDYITRINGHKDKYPHELMEIIKEHALLKTGYVLNECQFDPVILDILPIPSIITKIIKDRKYTDTPSEDEIKQVNNFARAYKLV